MTPPPTTPLLLLLLTHHLTAAAAALLVLLDPPAPSARKRRRLDVEELDPVPPPSLQPEPEPLPLPPTSPDHYPLAFRVSAPTFNFLAGLLDPLLSHPSLPSSTLLALALARLATGLPYATLAALFRVPASAPRAASAPPPPRAPREIPILARVPGRAEQRRRVFPSPVLPRGLCFAPLEGPEGPLAGSCLRRFLPVLFFGPRFPRQRNHFQVVKFYSFNQELEQGKVLDHGQYLAGYGDGYPFFPWLMVPFRGPAVPRVCRRRSSTPRTTQRAARRGARSGA
ncbi:hypothetical protein OsJ_20241 [Oryza sativa Japonica Group]|uniref:Uncharacterized protein n=1 Tax=Oryza sativa subsp. japonica TaxID=39947 RepID=A3B8P9_ORYSJ|nr:hypothetical protein OsJ_20241 [Oryza sativa Japonica Group]